MRTFLLMLVLVVSLQAQSSDYRHGFDKGWKDGWHYVRGQYEFPPFPPFPDFPAWGYDNFKGGYQAGFLAGIAKASE